MARFDPLGAERCFDLDVWLDGEPPETASRYTETYVAQVLAESGCDLADSEACVAALVAAGVKPEQIPTGWLSIRTRAHDMREEAKRVEPVLSIVRDAACVAALLAIGLVWTGPAGAAVRAECPATEMPWPGLIVFAAILLVIGFVFGCAARFVDRPASPEFLGEHGGDA